MGMRSLIFFDLLMILLITQVWNDAIKYLIPRLLRKA